MYFRICGTKRGKRQTNTPVLFIMYNLVSKWNFLCLFVPFNLTEQILVGLKSTSVGLLNERAWLSLITVFGFLRRSCVAGSAYNWTLIEICVPPLSVCNEPLQTRSELNPHYGPKQWAQEMNYCSLSAAGWSPNSKTQQTIFFSLNPLLHQPIPLQHISFTSFILSSQTLTHILIYSPFFFYTIGRQKVERGTLISGCARQQWPQMMDVIILLQNECIYY